MAKKLATKPTVSVQTNSKRILAAVQCQTLVSNDPVIARKLVSCGAIKHYAAHELMLRQGDPDNDILMLLSGEVAISVNGREVARRSAGTHVGEMALVDALSRRSATVRSVEPTTILTIPEYKFTKVANAHPELWRRIAVELAKRLRERNKVLMQPHNEPVLFIGSSLEGQEIASDLYERFRIKRVVPKAWTDGVFQASATSIESLIAATNESDFAVLVLTADDVTISRKKAKQAPRDNVVFELGLFMGALGRNRVFILKPKGLDVRIPSDLLGVVWVEYLSTGVRSRRLEGAFRTIFNSITRIGPR